MSDLHLVEVTTPTLAREFLRVNVDVNRNDPGYIRPLNKDINHVFDSKKNKAFRHGKTARWILKNGNDGLIGRIAAFTNKKYKNKGDDVPVGGIGFFDCINNQEAADMLFDVAKHWLLQNGMEAMDGPINFGERDRWWGLLVDGFHPPVYCMNYNQSYYEQLFENYGFKNFFNQICFGLDPKKELNKKTIDRHDAIASDPGYKALHIQKKDLEKFANDFTIVYNKAWAGHGGAKQLAKDAVLKMFKTMKPVMDERISWFAYYNNEPIAIFINIPDLNQWFKHLNGRFSLFHQLKFLWIKLTKPCKKFTGIVFGVVPDFQSKGIDAYIIGESAKIIQPQTSYSEYEMQWIGDFNPKMINVAENFGETLRTRRLVTYRYFFDRTREFKRHPILS